MRIQDKLVPYLEYCEYRKELDKKTIKAYRIDLRQYFASAKKLLKLSGVNGF